MTRCRGFVVVAAAAVVVGFSSPPALRRQILAARSFRWSSPTPTQVLTGQAELAVSEAEEARPSGHSGLKRSFRRPRRHLRGRHGAIADRDLSSSRSHAVMPGAACPSLARGNLSDRGASLSVDWLYDAQLREARRARTWRYVWTGINGVLAVGSFALLPFVERDQRIELVVGGAGSTVASLFTWFVPLDIEAALARKVQPMAQRHPRWGRGARGRGGATLHATDAPRRSMGSLSSKSRHHPKGLVRGRPAAARRNFGDVSHRVLKNGSRTRTWRRAPTSA